jgi:hypothetical protein
MTDPNLIFKLARKVTERYLEESRERFDAAERAQLARIVLDKTGGDAAVLERFYSDPVCALAAEFVEGGDHSFERMMQMVDERFKGKDGTTE